MKLLFLFLSFFILQQSFAQLSTNVFWTQNSSMPSSDVIYYDSQRNLVWKDFAANSPLDKGMTAALTVSGFGYDANIKTVNGKGQLNVSVYCYFSKDKSWVKPGKNNAYILTHEQHHFDVSYIGAGIFMDKLRSAKFTTKNYNELLPRLYNECFDIMNKMQTDYDGQTKNGLLTDEQSKWNALIDSRLDAIVK